MKELIAFGVSIALCSTVVAGEFHVSPAGSDANGGTKAAPLKTISAAAAKAQPGDLITVHEGVYRERINPPRGGTSDEKRIVYQAAPGENVVIKGSERVTGWTHVEKDAWKVTLPDSFFGDFNPYGDLLHGDWYEAKQPYHTGAVYLNGHWLKEAARKNLVVESAPSGAVEEGRPELMNIRQLITGGKNGKNLMAAEFKSASDGVEIIKLPDGLTCVGRMRDGATLTYEMEVGEEARHLATYAASPLEGGIIEIRKGSAEGELLGKFDVGFTAEWTSFQPYHANLSQPLSGKQILTLVFKARPRQLVAPSDDSAFWFAEFGKESTTIWAQFKGVDPNKELVEINVRQSVFYPDQTGRNFITVKGFTLEQAATPWAPPTAEQIGLIGAHWSKGWVIEENTIRYSTCAGVSLGKDRDEMDNKHDMRATIRLATKAGWSGENVGHHLVRNNQIDNCGQAALVGSLGGIFSTIEGNEIHDIRKNHDYGGCETAGIKMHGAVDVVIRDNHIYNCAHWGGLWLDWMAQGARVTGNLLHDNSQDMMLEVNHGPFLVDNNLLLSRQQITKVSSSGAYVHNLWSDNFGIWPTEGRQTPYFKPHSTEIIKESAINQNDDRYFNNIFVGPKGTSAMDEHGFSLIGSGNVFLGGAIPSKNEQKAIEAKDFDPKMEFTKESDGWWLKMTVDPAWSKEVQRNVVTTELLGKAAVTGAAYEQRDGKPHQLDTDYFGNKWPENSPSPGPFALSGEKELRVKVWPKKANTEGSLAARKNAPTTEKEEDVKSLTYKKVGDAELEMKIHYPAHWEAGGKKLPAIVLFFGGGWYAGDIGQFRFTAPYLAQRGMIVVTPEYRTIKKHGVTPVQCLADAKSAMRYVHKNATALGIDAGRIAAGGISAGGHLAAATAFSKGFDDPDDDLQINCKPSALVLIVPVIDNGPGGFAHSQVSAYWEAFSPMHNIGLNPPPTLFMVGDSDKYIPVATAQKFKAEIEKHGGRCDLKIFENADHAFNFSPTGSKATLQDMDDFLVSLGYLKTKEIPLDKK